MCKGNGMDRRHEAKIRAMGDEGNFEGTALGLMFWTVAILVYLAPRYFMGGLGMAL